MEQGVFLDGRKLAIAATAARDSVLPHVFEIDPATRALRDISRGGCADKFAGIRKYYADPDHPAAEKQLALFATEKYLGAREGLALYAQPGGQGYLIATDQVPQASRFHLYSRDTNQRVGTLLTGADSTDGVEAAS